MEVVINLFRDSFVDARDGFEIGQAGSGNPAGRAEMQQQRAFAFSPDARDLVQRRARDVRRALGAVSPDSEAMGLVAQALQVVEHGIARLQAEGCLAGPKEPLAAGV